MATLCSPKMYITDPTVMEASATWNVMLFGRDLGLCNIIREGDALEIVHALWKDDKS
jgi:hypothetical protein